MKIVSALSLLIFISCMRNEPEEIYKPAGDTAQMAAEQAAGESENQLIQTGNTTPEE